MAHSVVTSRLEHLGGEGVVVASCFWKRVLGMETLWVVRRRVLKILMASLTTLLFKKMKYFIDHFLVPIYKSSHNNKG